PIFPQSAMGDGLCDGDQLLRPSGATGAHLQLYSSQVHAKCRNSRPPQARRIQSNVSRSLWYLRAARVANCAGKAEVRPLFYLPRCESSHGFADIIGMTRLSLHSWELLSDKSLGL